MLHLSRSEASAFKDFYVAGFKGKALVKFCCSAKKTVRPLFKPEFPGNRKAFSITQPTLLNIVVVFLVSQKLAKIHGSILTNCSARGV